MRIAALGLCLVMLAGSLTYASDVTEVQSEAASDGEVKSALAQIDNAKWQYNEEDDVYYQTGIAYCENPADEAYETLAVFVPGAYMDASDNGDGTYTCEVNQSAVKGNYTAETAPIVLPVNTPGYSAQAALTEYQSFTEYTDEGIIYVHAGCRGRDAGAPSGVTDLKAAIRYIRYNAGSIAGDTEKIFSFGMSGGGAQSALLGVTGDSDLYEDYLEEIGAVMETSDAVYGSMAWCPITSLDTADAAYEWNMGSTRTNLTEEEQTISDKLTEAYAAYINELGLTDSEGNTLTLEQSEDGNWQAGTYYEFVKSAIEESLNQFLTETEFPYNADSSAQGHMAGMGAGRMNGGFPGGKDKAFGKTGSSDASGEVDITQIDDISRMETSGGVNISGTYETVQDYIDALNANGQWVTYDEDTNTASITSVADFAAAMKNASKELGAFDQLDEGQGENQLFGTNGTSAHFDATLAEILTEIGSPYAEDYAQDLETKDDLGHTVEERVNMYSPMYYLMAGSEGYGTSTIAQYFRIRTGISQGDTAVNTELNLAQALENEGTNVDFAMVWGQEHTMAETEGSSTENFVAWIHECMGF